MPLSAYRVALVMLTCTNEVALAANPDNGSTLAQRGHRLSRCLG
jgi:hypothetical protein